MPASNRIPWHQWVRNERQERMAQARRNRQFAEGAAEWTIKYCAEKARMSEDSWRKMENTPVHQPRRETVLKVAFALDLEADQVLRIAGLSPTDADDYPNLPGRLLGLYASLPEADQLEIQEFIEFKFARYRRKRDARS